jgi:hypothetical protein
MFQLVTEIININLILKATDFSISALVKWVLSACLNIHTLRLYSKFVKLNGFHDEIARLQKLKELHISPFEASELKLVTFIDFRIRTKLLIFL